MASAGRAGLVLAIALFGNVATAHHSNAMFDQKNRKQLVGTVREFQWTNPHCFIQLLVRDDRGRDKEWNIEMGANFYLQNHGWRRSTLKPGDRIRVTVSPLRNGGPSGLFFEATTIDGKPLVPEVK